MATKGKAPESERNCVLCCQELELLALGKCDHPVCYRCSTKMRVLCDQRYCAVCREELDKVVFTRKLAPFSTIVTHQFQYDKQYDIYFADVKAQSEFRKLLKHECPECPDVRPFNTVEELEQHMRKQHELFCCKLCVRHLKIFTYERRWYNRKDLARHRIHGDPDNTSHRGHPLCKFCDERYLDNDELLKHLRRDHYFCHFCDSEGAQEYYSDYEYLREHFREKHFLCEEGRCSTEQFTHAFRTEIDYRAHKATYHSKNRAEARQNRQIDLQFNYAPRNQRRNEGVISGEDYEEVDRFNRYGRPGRGGSRGGGGQSKRGSWRYNREEEDRDVAAAVRASVAARRQREGNRSEDKDNSNSRRQREGNRSEDKDNGNPRRHREGIRSEDKDNGNPRRQKEGNRSEDKDSGNPRRQREGNRSEQDSGNINEEEIVDYSIKHTTTKREEMRDAEEICNSKSMSKPSSDITGSKEVTNPAASISSLSKEVFPVLGNVAAMPGHSYVKPAPVELKEEDFPSLSSTGPATVTAGLTTPYTASARKTSAFQEEDFPALVPKIKPHNPVSTSASAWSNGSNKKTVKPVTHTNSTCSQVVKKPVLVNSNKGSIKNKKASISDDEDDGSGMTAKELRSAPTMFDISSLLTTSTTQTVGKVGKKKKVGAEKQAIAVQPSPDRSDASSFQKENVPELAPASFSTTAAPPLITDTVINGHSEKTDESSSITKVPPGLKKPATAAQCPIPEEDFPALGNPSLPRKPPPGFTNVLPVTSLHPNIPPPPPGLSVPVSKPPPGFTDIPSSRDIPPEPVILTTKQPVPFVGVYSVPDNFQDRNIKLIQAIKEFLENDDSKFNEFKTYSGQFRQGRISAAQYYRSCRELLGENFRKLFNELLVLLPDVAKQQELLSAHNDFRITEKQGSNKSKKNKKNVWQTDSNSELDCKICAICRQVLTEKDFTTHKALHIEDDEFPSLQSISRIIS